MNREVKDNLTRKA